MRAIPGIRYSFIGTPAADARDVVDNSFTYYWLVTFDDKAAWKVYDTHPLHDTFRTKSALWKKVVVYDQGGTFMATRLFFALYHHGYPAGDLFLLDGGLAKWQEHGLPVTAEATPAPGNGSFRIRDVREDVRVRLPEFLAASGDLANNALVEALEPDWHFGEVLFFGRLDASVFTLLGLCSASALFWLPMPNSYSWGSLSIMLALVLLLFAEQRPFGATAYVIASALTLSFTVTNWMAGLLVTLVRWPWKQAVQLSVNALCVVVLLWGVQKFIFPTAEFFIGHREEAEFINHPQSGGVANVLSSLVFHTVVAPDVRFMKDDAYTQAKSDSFRLSERLTFQFSRPGSTGPLGLLAVGIDIVLTVDVSGSMLAEDFEIGGQRYNRLHVIKPVVKDFILKRTNDRIGLVVFAGRPYTQCPMTLDYGMLLQLLEKVEIGMVEDGTAIGSALGSSIERLKNTAAKSKVIILLTDGRNNSGEIDPFTAAEIARTFGIKINTIGAGTKGLAPFPAPDIFGNRVIKQVKIDIDDDALREIAKITDGNYYRATDTESLKKIYRQIDKLEKTESPSSSGGKDLQCLPVNPGRV